MSTENGYGLAAILGLRAHENLFVQPDGAWRHGALPAFIRRYPLVLAESEGGSNFTVCLDRAYAGLNTQDGQALFEADGRETPWLEEIKQFLVAFRRGDGGQPGSGPAARRTWTCSKTAPSSTNCWANARPCGASRPSTRPSSAACRRRP